MLMIIACLGKYRAGGDAAAPRAGGLYGQPGRPMNESLKQKPIKASLKHNIKIKNQKHITIYIYNIKYKYTNKNIKIPEAL